MNTNEKTTMKLWHSPAAFVAAGHGQDIAAALERPASSPECELPPRLELKVTSGGGADILMTPSDSFEASGRKFEIYSAHIPAAAVVPGKLEYTVSGGGCRVDCSVEAVELPALPPVIITEVYGRPKSPAVTAYLELYNPGKEDVDLSDWDLILTSEKTEPSRYPLALAPGEAVLHGGELAVWWPLLSGNFGVGAAKRDYVTAEDFCREMNAMYTPPVPEPTPETVRVIPVAYTVREADGTLIKKYDLPALPHEYHPWTFSLVPHGGEAAEAVYSLTYNTIWGNWDTPVRRSSDWTVDLRRPSVAVNVSHNAAPTPGGFSRGQAAFDADASPAVLLPLGPDDAIYLGDGKHEITFAAVPTEACHPVASAWVTVIASDGTVLRLDAEEGDDGLYRAALPYSLTERLATLEYSIHATDGSREVTLAGLRSSVYDNAGPRVCTIHPTEKYAYDISDGTPVWAEFYDISGVRLSECRLEVDGRDLTRRAEWSGEGVRYTPSVPFAVGEHELRLVLCDMLGNHTVKKVHFSVSDMSDLFAYRGEVHSHTGDSDGVGTPADAYTYARDVGHADYFAVTDHSHYISEGTATAAKLRETADRFDDPGKFAALFGYEMTWNMMCGYWGHMNVIGSGDVENRIYTTTLPALYDKLEKDPDAVAMFNHPGYPWGDFDEYAYRTDAADEKVCLTEIRDASYDREYAMGLAAGWHATPVSNEDNHSATWTTARQAIGFVLAPALTRDNIMDAFRARRTYTASEPTLKIKYRVNGKWLGSKLNNPEKLDFDISISTEDARGIGKIEIVAEDNIVVAARNAGALKQFDWKLTLAPDFDYYYLRITAQGQYSVTAPVWVENRCALTLGGIETGASYNPERGTAARLRITNAGESAAKDIRVDFYLSRTTGFDLRDEVPYATVHCGKLAAGQTVRVSRSFPELAVLHRISAVVSAEIDGKHVVATATTLISPVTIAEILPYSMPLERDGVKTDDPFPYVVLYNSSSRAQDLSGATLRLWSQTGKAPSEDRTWKFPAGTVIKPRSVMMVWVRYENPGENPELTVADLNERYGTSFAEGEDLVICSKHILSRSVYGRRLELVTDEVISRAHWNYAAAFDGDAHRGRARRYAKRPGLCPTAAPLGLFDPAPGTLDDEQKRDEFSTAPTKNENRQRRRDEKTDAKRAARRERLSVTDGEAAAMAAASAAAVGGIAALVGIIGGKKKKGRKNI